MALQTTRLAFRHIHWSLNWRNGIHLPAFTRNIYPQSTIRIPRQLSTVCQNSIHLHPVLSGMRPPVKLLPLTSKSVQTTSTTRGAESCDVDQVKDAYHSIITDKEREKGTQNTLEFQAETKKLLNIVAQSLYSEREVFIRELISNASDTIETMRYYQLTGDYAQPKDVPLEIHIACDDEKKTFTIQDTGTGMTREELIQNLGRYFSACTQYD